MSNNIYDILKTLNGLENPQQKKSLLSESKEAKMCNECGMYESKCKCDHESDKKDKKKDKGAIAEAVARVEKQLSEKFHDYKKSMKEGDDGFKYTPDPNDALDQYFAKMYPTDKAKSYTRQELPGKPLPPIDNRSRPEDKFKTKPKTVDESGLMYHAGVKKHGKKYMDLAREAGQKGASQEELGRLKDEHSKAYKNKKMDEGDYNEDMLSPKQQKIAKMNPPTNKIDAGDFAKLRAGKKSMKDEGNEFSGNRQDAIDAGKTSFKVDGKTYPVKEGFEDLEKYMKEKEGKTTHGKKTKTKSGLKHERDYDKEENEKETGEEKKGRGRPKKDKFYKKNKK